MKIPQTLCGKDGIHSDRKCWYSYSFGVKEGRDVLCSSSTPLSSAYSHSSACQFSYT